MRCILEPTVFACPTVPPKITGRTTRICFSFQIPRLDCICERHRTVEALLGRREVKQLAFKIFRVGTEEYLPGEHRWHFLSVLDLVYTTDHESRSAEKRSLRSRRAILLLQSHDGVSDFKHCKNSLALMF